LLESESRPRDGFFFSPSRPPRNFAGGFFTTAEKEIIMTARTVIESLSGAVLSISASNPATYDLSGFGGLGWTPVGQIENYGNHGMTAAVTEFTPVDTAVVAKVKGSKNYGTQSLVIGNMPGDAGQALLKAASESPNRYSVKILYPDTSIHYLDALVSKFEYVDGAVNDVQKVNCDLVLCRAPVIFLP
jgi:hypothetical protein